MPQQDRSCRLYLTAESGDEALRLLVGCLTRQTSVPQTLCQVGQLAEMQFRVKRACVGGTSDNDHPGEEDNERDHYHRDHRCDVAVEHQVDEGRRAEDAKGTVD